MSRTLNSSVVMLIGVVLLGSAPGFAASGQSRSDRPRIGLVLGGGGAKGGSHIGVLKVLEELRVPIDFIAGTSVGAVMGGLYASGVTVDSLESAIRSIDWRDLLTDRVPRHRLTFLRKQVDQNIPSRFELGFNRGGFQLPPGLITGQNVENTVRSLALPAARIRSFGLLPIPFSAVATDLVSGEMVVLSEGDLATALRASMSLPGAFAPVEVDGRLLVDGAVVRNLPVDVVREMGADVVIAVDLSSVLRSRDELASALDVSGQVGSISTRANTLLQRESLVAGRDVLLVPDVNDVQVIDFRLLPQTITRGEDVTRALAGQLREYALDAVAYAEYQGRFRRDPQQPVILDSIRFEGSQRLRDQVLRARLDLSTGRPLSAGELRAALERLSGLGLYERVDYRVEPEGTGATLVVRLREKAWGPGYTRVGVAFGNDLVRGSSSFTLLASHTQTAINRQGGELRSVVRIGEGQGLSGTFHQPLDDGGRYFSEASVFYREERLDVAVAGAGSESRGVDELGVALAAGLFVGNWGEIRVEASRGRVDRKGAVLAANPLEADPDAGGVLGRITWDALDDRAFPNRGVAGFVELYRGAETLGSDPGYSRFEASVFGVAGRGQDALLLSGRIGTSFDGVLPPQHDFWLGGLGQLSGIRVRDLVGNHLLFARVGYRRSLAVLPFGLAGGDLYGGVNAEVGNTWADRSQVDLADLHASLGVYLGLETFLGPMYLSAAKADRGDYALFLSLGHAF